MSSGIGDWLGWPWELSRTLSVSRDQLGLFAQVLSSFSSFFPPCRQDISLTTQPPALKVCSKWQFPIWGHMVTEASPVQNLVPIQNHQERKSDWPARSWMHFCSTVDWGAGRGAQGPLAHPQPSRDKTCDEHQTGGRVLRRAGHGDGVRAVSPQERSAGRTSAGHGAVTIVFSRSACFYRSQCATCCLSQNRHWSMGTEWTNRKRS